MRGFHVPFVLVLVLSFVACKQKRGEMPITTTSEEARELFIKARDMFENYDLLRADSLLLLALELDPDFALAHLFLYSRDGDSIANQLVNQVSRGEAYMIKAWNAHAARDYSLCDNMTDSLLAYYPKDKHCLYFAGNRCVDRDKKKAIDLFNQASKSDRYYAAPHMFLADLYLLEKRYKEAGERYIRYLELMPNSGYGYHAYCNLLQAQGQNDEALNQYLTSIRIDPGFHASYWGALSIYNRRGEFDLVWKYSDQLYQISKTLKDKEKALYWKANVLLIRDSLDAAFDIMDQIIQLARDNGDLRKEIYMRHYKGWFALAGNKPNLAMAIFNNNLEMAKHKEFEEEDKMRLMMRSYGCISILYGQLKNIPNAEEYLNMAREIFVSRNHSSDILYMNLYEGVYAINTENFELAESHLNQPDYHGFVAYHYYLAEACRLLGHKEKAISNYKLARSTNSQYWSALFYNKSKERLKGFENQ